MQGDFKLFARRENFADGIALAAIRKVDGGLEWLDNVTVRREDEDYVANPFLHLSTTQAQHLIDELWDCGLRPSEGSGSAGAMAAVQRHLEDMRTLVFEQRTSVDTIYRIKPEDIAK